MYLQQGGQQDQIMQIIQAYAQMSQMDPRQLMEQLKKMPAEKQQQAIQQMMQALQQGDEQQEQPDMTQAAMAYGGYTTGMFAAGGQMMKRADGSYSRRGMWDNIRENKGSGKKPTKQMLKQERKIRAKEMKNGGINNVGFDALPPEVREQIINGMSYGGFYNSMMATGGEKMPPEIARARFAAAGNMDKMADYGYAFGGYIPEMMYGGNEYMADGGESNAGMAMGQIAGMHDKLSRLQKFINSPEIEVDPWVASKITLADDYLNSVADYMQYGEQQEPENEMQPEQMEQQGMEQMANGGYTVTRSSDRKGKTHKVTGPDGTVKYFGDSNLGQHPKDPERKKAFYARHKKNLAGNPYFRAFARKTWEQGGQIDEMKGGGNTYSNGVFYENGGFIPPYNMGGMPYDIGSVYKMGGSMNRSSTNSNNFTSNNLDIGDELEVTPQQLEQLRAQGYQFVKI